MISAKSLDRDAIVDNYARAYASATDDLERDGRAWYGSARETCERMAAESGRSARDVAAIVAVLSPQVRWAPNIAAAREALELPADPSLPSKYGVLGESWRKATRILLGESADDVLSGPKVTAFDRALRGDLSAVVVDTWMIAAAGVDIGALTPAKYRVLAECIALAADDAGELPAVFQAIVWCAVRGASE